MAEHESTTTPTSPGALTDHTCPECRRRLTVREAQEAENAGAKIDGDLYHVKCYYGLVGTPLENGK